ncbi:MAG TPA: potassium-transporting ATPase subunit KdpA, partial [Gemmatimonadaceae bacterium]
MTLNGWLQILFYAVLLFALTKPLGAYMVRVYDGSMGWLGWLERPIYRLCAVDPGEDQHWTRYTGGLLLFSLASMLLTYLFLRLQAVLPLNPAHLPAVTDRQSFETAASFTTNTNWQSYGGETTMSYFSQMTQLTFHNFTSAAAGMAALVALIRGVARHGGEAKGRVGNFWTDLVRGTLYILLPLSLVVALVLVQQGVIQNFSAYAQITTLEGAKQTLAMGPAASQIAIKQLGTNGGGFFNVNSAHPFENSTPWSNFIEMFSILALAAALTWTYGKMVKRQAHGWALWAAMFAIFAAGEVTAYWAEARGNPIHAARGVDVVASSTNPGGNMEGKEVRFGLANSTLWAVATTDASNGSVNSMHDSFTPIGGMVP